MARQDQTLSGSLQDSQVQLAQAGENALSFQNSHDNQITILKTFQLFGFGGAAPAAATPDWDYAQEILKDQRYEIQTRLQYILADLQHLMAVDFQWVKWASPLQVSLQAQRQLEIEGRDQGILDNQKLLIETFGAVGGKLLILGTPGAGKTTALLELAEQLVCGAIAQPQTLIPVIFELSTWQKDEQSIENWLVERLHYQYGGQRQVYKTWIERKKLLPLLDGLDELGLARQKACTEKLNEFARTYLRLVVCCRVKEFEQVGINLTNLRGSVCLEPLSDPQIQDYWETTGQTQLWAEIQQNQPLQQLLEPTTEGDPGLLRIPLFVTLAARVYTPQHPFQGKRDLLEQYVDYQLSRDGRAAERRKELEGKTWAYQTLEAEPSRQETKQTLAWIARQLQRENQVELLIEKIQPRWLESQTSRSAYRLILGLIGWLIGWLIGGLIGGLSEIEPVEAFQLSLSPQVIQTVLRSLRDLLIYGLIVGLIVGLSGWLIRGLIVGLIVLIVGLIEGLIRGLKQELQLRLHPNQGIKNSLQSMVWTTLFSYPLGIIVAGIPVAFGIDAKSINQGESLVTIFYTLWTILPEFLIPGIFVALFFGFLVGGGVPVVEHYCLRFVLAQQHIAPWDLPRFLNYCVERRLLQRVGGRYRFLHRELLDFFADSTAGFSPTQRTSPNSYKPGLWS